MESIQRRDGPGEVVDDRCPRKLAETERAVDGRHPVGRQQHREEGRRRTDTRKTKKDNEPSLTSTVIEQALTPSLAVGKYSCRYAIEEIYNASLQRILGADDEQAVVLNQLLENL